MTLKFWDLLDSKLMLSTINGTMNKQIFETNWTLAISRISYKFEPRATSNSTVGVSQEPPNKTNCDFGFLFSTWP